MKQPLPLTLALVTLALAASAALAPLQAQALVEPSLAAALASTADDDTLEVIVTLANPLDATELERRHAVRPLRERRAAISDDLRAHFATTRAPLADTLLELEASSDLRRVRDLWIANAFIADATPLAIETLAVNTRVTRMHLVSNAPLSSIQDSAPPAPPAPPVASFPFFDDFDSGVLGPAWTVNATGTGFAEVTSDFDPRGTHHVVLSCANTASLVQLTLELDLAGQSDVGLRFRFKEFNDENDPEDAVLVSDDGVNFVELMSLQNGPPNYEARFVDLDEAVGPLGLSLTSTFFVRFQWTDNISLPNDGFAFDEIEVAPGVGVQPPPDVLANIVGHGAPQLWEIGFDGSGVLVGSIDSGVALTHPDLAGSIWSNPGEIPGNGIDDDSNGYVDDIAGYDFFHDDGNPSAGGDPHGTNSAGLIVGDGTSGIATGMAPGATLVVTEVDNEASYMLAQQYLLNVGVDVITSSYSFKWPDRPDYATFRAITNVELAAGIIHANSIGNQGPQASSTHPRPFNIAAPANAPSPFAHPDLEAGGRSSVLACGGINLGTDAAYALTGVGPAAWEDFSLYDPAWPHIPIPIYYDYPFGGFGGALPGLIKPDLVTYTNVTTTTIPGASGFYGFYSGTSASTPHLGGALALLRHVQPLAEPRHLAAALELSATDLGATGKNNLFGSGKVEVFDAARRLLVLTRANAPSLQLGETLTLDITGEPGALAFGFVGLELVHSPNAFNLTFPFVELPPLLFDGSGATSLDLLVPVIPELAGITLWFQFGSPPGGFKTDWSGGPVISVPEGVALFP